MERLLQARVEQGFDPVCTDPSTLATIARLLRDIVLPASATVINNTRSLDRRSADK